jgi:hypothetical protein
MDGPIAATSLVVSDQGKAMAAVAFSGVDGGFTPSGSESANPAAGGLFDCLFEQGIQESATRQGVCFPAR